MRRSRRALRALVLVLALAPACALVSSVAAPSRASAAEESGPASGTVFWYVLRGRANMKIGNYRAAVEAWQKAVELDPELREASRELGIAWEKQGQTAKAIEQFDRYLARFDDDPEIAFKQADYLRWERYAYRRADAIRYYRMGLARQEDLRRRHRLARLLAQQRGDLDAALAEYRVLLRAEPGRETWRAEYRELLLWDERHLDEAIREYRKLERDRPDDDAIERKLAELIARDEPRGDEAAARYAALVAAHPGDRALAVRYAEVLAASPKRRTLAIEQYRRVLANDPRPEYRLALADLLAASDDTRAEALAEYRTLLRERPRDTRARLHYARLLAGRRADVGAAITEYQRVVAQEPKNARAHEGLAEAYAWTGDRDAALHHANLAALYAKASDGEAADLRASLQEGREPRVSPFARVLVQEGRSDLSALRGFWLGASGRADPTPFLTLALESGLEAYWHDAADDVSGWFALDGEYRIDPRQHVELGLGYHGLPGGSRNVLFHAAYVRGDDRLRWRAGFERSLRFDSYAALVGANAGGLAFGSARENRFHAELATRRGRLAASVSPYVGWVSSLALSADPFVGVRGELRYALREGERLDFSATYAADLYGYGEDAFGFAPSASEPLPGGFFSPAFFFEQVPGVALGVRLAERHYVDLEGGPALQLVDEAVGGVRFELGGRAHLAYTNVVRESLFWSLESDFQRIGDAYTRVEARASVTFLF